MKNWKTTLAGVAGGALNLYANGTTWQDVAFSTCIVLVGALAKDRNVTHSDGTIAATVKENKRRKGIIRR